MPRHYERKRGSRPYQTSYTEKSMEDAISFFRNNGGTVRGVAKKFGVPHTTLGRKIKGKIL